jgi:hypothetical protein
MPLLVWILRTIRLTYRDLLPHGGWLPSAMMTVVKVTLPYGLMVPVPWFLIVQRPVPQGGVLPVTVEAARPCIRRSVASSPMRSRRCDQTAAIPGVTSNLTPARRALAADDLHT